MTDADALEISQLQQRINELWVSFLDYARAVEARSSKYVASISTSGDQALEQTRGLFNWVVRTKGSYESKLWEMDVLLNHLQGTDNAVAYLGYDSKTHPDVSIVNRKANTAVAIELKQVETDDHTKVHGHIYDALGQLWLREYFDNHTPFTRWKAYIYINANNGWPWTKLTDNGKTFQQLIMEKADEQKKTVHWGQWTTLTGAHQVEISIWHAKFGRCDYVLAP